MSMIKCPECGKEISNQAKFCPNCGYPIPQFKKRESQTFDDIDGEINTGIFGDKDIACPVCSSKYFDIANDIPLHRKILELWLIGTILPQTKNRYKKDMIYKCRKCDTVWNKDKLIKAGEPNGYKPSPALPITIGIISILFSLILFVLAFTATIITGLLLIIAFITMLAAGIATLVSTGKIKVARAGCVLYKISVIILLITFLLGGANFLPVLISGIFFWCMRLYEKKLS